MKLIFVHGWSVTHTNTYGTLPQVIADHSPDDLDIQISHIFLGEYISFRDEVKVSDLVVALEQALADTLAPGEPFSCITHSTGGPVVREWINTYYGKDRLDAMPLRHLIMLAPANHGSALAQLGKERVGRIKAWFDGVEPGEGILEWLELGSSDQWSLNSDWLEYPESEHFFPFVITGQDIDKKFYDYLNSYTAEKGGDGVIRVASANLNYHKVQLYQRADGAFDFLVPNSRTDDTAKALPLDANDSLQSPNYTSAFEILPNTCHSQDRKGIMASVTKGNYARKQVFNSIIECLCVDSVADYKQVASNMTQRTHQLQSATKNSSRSPQHCMIIFRVVDTKGKLITDYDLYLLAGRDFQPDKLPKGFFADRQKNTVNQCHLTYFFNHKKLSEISAKRDNCLGFRVIARPDRGFAYYKPAEFRSNGIGFSELIKANETLMVEIVLRRYVAKNAFQFTSAENEHESFKHRQPNSNVGDLEV